ncbi:MAG: hypothetical protein C4542_08055 [Dehalococcoidia bacterium]|nr:MAG: hypothetical protein C4542_08055 [Dehalococcoidia bacterium]
MSEQEVIQHLQKKIERLEAELSAERMKPKEILPVPYPYPPVPQWPPYYTWTTPNTGTPPPKPDYEITCGDDIHHAVFTWSCSGLPHPSAR